MSVAGLNMVMVTTQNSSGPDVSICISLCFYSLSHIVVLVGVFLVTLHIVPVNKRLYPLLQVSRLPKKEKQQINDHGTCCVASCLPPGSISRLPSAVNTEQIKQKKDCSNHLDRKLELVVHFRHQKIMTQRLSHLHNPHDGSINLILAILKDPFCCASLLLHLYRGIGVNHDARQGPKT